MGNVHRVKVDNYEFVHNWRQGEVRIERNGERWIEWTKGESAIVAMMNQLDAARGVVAAARALADHMERMPLRELEALTKGDAFVGIARAINAYDSLTSDREPPSAWCGVEASNRPDVQPSTDTDIDGLDAEIRLMENRAPCIGERWQRGLVWLKELRDRRLGSAIAAETERIRRDREPPPTDPPARVGYLSSARISEIGRSAARAAEHVEPSVVVNTVDLQLLVGEVQRRRAHDQAADDRFIQLRAQVELDRDTYCAFVGIDNAQTIGDLDALWQKLDGKLGWMDREDALERYEQRRKVL